eukprot:CAMPEP_0168281822 /NCGR_PEP_ID=MMETSP0141_2-20121125/21970_1 /TAXON_ID=44445 /ORGANISM="Pseudo-nitzschia australis, Strain 10249 10 AB" /LENGTH=478 /DNA_ID=CAMNT_0008225369 /DNA_START=266 /DNA_END=1702 /DNA_ORIENTATION=-
MTAGGDNPVAGVHRGTSDTTTTSNSNSSNNNNNNNNTKRHKFVGIASVFCLVIIASIGYHSFGAESAMISNGKSVSVSADTVTTTTSNNNDNDYDNNKRRRMSAKERLLESEPEPKDGATKEAELIAKISKKLHPVPLRFENGGGATVTVEGKVETITTAKTDKDSEKPKMAPYQVLHLHHMKTGGTSIDKLLRCSMNRLRREANYDVPYFSIHECSRKRFATCLTDSDNKCRDQMHNAAVMSYCAPLKYLDEFGWWNNNKEKDEDNQVKAFTVLRHPVERVWSMFRFQTKKCYECTPLKEIYQKLDRGEDTGLDKLCLTQLQNHEVNNLLSTVWPVDVTDLKLDLENGEDSSSLEIRNKMVQEAIDNMKGFFTVIGITEELLTYSTILGMVFPWMNHYGNDQDGTSSECPLSHANASPSNNRCGKDSTHWDLPAHPDEETRDLIIKYNSLDMELYEAAVEYFALQKTALGLIDNDEK